MFLSHVRADNTAVFMYQDPGHEHVFVTGSFCGWDTPGYQMHRIEGGWMAEVPDFPDGEYEYKFIVDGNWINDPNNILTIPDGSGGENSVIYNNNGKGSLYHFSFYSPAIDAYKGYVIYLPPSYFKNDAHFSTVYLLHGLLDWEYTWAHRGFIHLTLDAMRLQGKIGEMIVVMPRENGEYFNGDGRYADYITRDLSGHIDMEFKTISHPKHRAIDGLSTGGFSSIMLGSLNPHLYSSVAGMSGSYDRRVFETIKNNGENIRKYGVRFHISCGMGDASCAISKSVADTLKGEGAVVEYYENPGPHDWEFWGPSIAGNLEFHWWNFQR